MNTRQKILDRALEMFNERGIEYVGLRELAADLEIRVSNITYYFPTKDDLVFQISAELTKKNSEIIVDDESITMKGFLSMMYQVFQNHYAFRGLLRSFVHVMTQNNLVAASYQKTLKVRRATIASNIRALATNGYLKPGTTEDLDGLVTTISLVSRYWISEAAVFAAHLGRSRQISKYLLVVTTLLWTHASAKARKEIQIGRAHV